MLDLKQITFTGKLYVTICVMLGALCLYLAFDNIWETFLLHSELADASEINQTLKKEQDDLNKDIKNYNNEEYILKIARTKYYMTKESDEQVFTMGEEEGIEESIEE